MRKLNFAIGFIFITLGIILIVIDYWFGIFFILVGVFFQFKGSKKVHQILKHNHSEAPIDRGGE